MNKTSKKEHQDLKKYRIILKKARAIIENLERKKRQILKLKREFNTDISPTLINK